MRKALSFLAKDKRHMAFAALKALGEVPRIQIVAEHCFPTEFTFPGRPHHQRSVSNGLLKRRVDFGVIQDPSGVFCSAARLIVDLTLRIDQAQVVKAMVEHPTADCTKVTGM
jgi:hypothetical protein